MGWLGSLRTLQKRIVEERGQKESAESVSSTEFREPFREGISKEGEGLIMRGGGEKKTKVEVCFVEEWKGKEGEELTLPVWEENKREEGGVRQFRDEKGRRGWI